MFQHSEKSSLESILGDVEIALSVGIGRTMLPVRELLNLKVGSILLTGKLVGESVELLSEGNLLAHGEVVVINEKYGIRISEIMSREKSKQSSKRGEESTL
ncbi:FliM/FliN family flagellar motor switch protein [Deltaproteobacteria bacterium TL4]